MATETRTYVDADQEAFARAKGFLPGEDMGWKTPGLWVSQSGCVRVYPFTRFDETTWIRAIYYSANDSVPFGHSEYKHFKGTIAQTL